MKGSTIISVRAISCRDNKNGTFTLEIPCEELPNDQQKTLEQLFPNLLDRAYALLTQETLLASVATPAETMAKPVDRDNGKACKVKADDGFKSWKPPASTVTAKDE